MKNTARFLNSPHMEPIHGNAPFAISAQPLLFQYAGDPILQNQVDDFLIEWETTPPFYTPNGWLYELLGDIFKPNTVLVAPAGRVTDGPSVPRALQWYIDPAKFYRSGVMHDWMRGHFTTGNATTDGFLRDMATAEGVTAFKSYLIYAGVRVGTHAGYKCKLPDPIATCKTFATMRDVDPQQVWFDVNHFEMRFRREPA